MKILAESRRRIIAYLLGLLFVAVLNLFTSGILPLRNMTTLGYSALLMIWMVTIRQRIVNREQRILFFFGGALWLLLFLTRFFRYRIVDDAPVLARYFWYFYYVPFALAPMISMHSALVLGSDPISFAGRPEDGTSFPKPMRRHGRLLLFLWILSVLLGVTVLTNNLHHLAFRFPHGVLNTGYTHGPAYWVIITWSILGLLLSFFIYQSKNKLPMRGWRRFLPFLIAGVGLGLMAWYVICGGSPKVGGISLYNIQEVYAFTYVGIWESFIQTGLIPSNTDYEKLFALATIRADLVEPEGDAFSEEKGENPEDGEDLIIRTKPVRGGAIRWAEDFGPVRRLTEKLQEATEDLLEENELVEEENRIASQRAAAEAQRRLYERISGAVRGQTREIHDLMEHTRIPESFRADLARTTVLGTYIKRRANMELLLENDPQIPVGELMLAFQEQRGYLELCGIASEVRMCGAEKGPGPAGEDWCKVDGQLLIRVYDLYEQVLERVLAHCSAFSVRVGTEDGFSVAIETDAPASLLEAMGRSGNSEEQVPGFSVRTDDETTQVLIRERRAV